MNQSEAYLSIPKPVTLEQVKRVLGPVIDQWKLFSVMGYFRTDAVEFCGLSICFNEILSGDNPRPESFTGFIHISYDPQDGLFASLLAVHFASRLAYLTDKPFIGFASWETVEFYVKGKSITFNTNFVREWPIHFINSFDNVIMEDIKPISNVDFKYPTFDD